MRFALIALLTWLGCGSAVEAQTVQFLIPSAPYNPATGQITSMNAGRSNSAIYSSSTAQTANTTSPVSLFSGTFSGSPGGLVIGANSLAPYVNNRFHLRAAGLVSTGGLFVGSATYGLYFGSNSTPIITKGSLSVGASLTNAPFIADANCVVGVLNGASTPIYCDGDLNINGTVTPIVGSSTFDATSNFTLDMRITWSSLTGTPSLVIGSSFAEIQY